MKHIRAILVTTVLLAACGVEPTATRDATAMRGIAATKGLGAAVEQDLAALREVTAPFHDFAAAKRAGYTVEVTGCMADPAAGGMGFHFGNPQFINGSVNVREPELLLYEPEKNGQMRLVAVEYIVPFDQWTAPDPPRLFGRDFARNETFQVWALHAWVWKHNPSGIFADWNPNVGCANAPVMSMAR